MYMCFAVFLTKSILQEQHYNVVASDNDNKGILFRCRLLLTVVLGRLVQIAVDVRDKRMPQQTSLPLIKHIGEYSQEFYH